MLWDMAVAIKFEYHTIYSIYSLFVPSCDTTLKRIWGKHNTFQISIQYMKQEKPTKYNKFNLQDHTTPRHVVIRSRQITSNYYDYNSPKPELRTFCGNSNTGNPTF